MGAPFEAGSNTTNPLGDRQDNLTTEDFNDRTLNLVEDDTDGNYKNQYVAYTNEVDYRVLALDLIHKLSNEIYETNQSTTLMQEIVEIITSSFPITYACIEKYDENSKLTFSALSIDSNVKLIQEPRSLLKLDETLSGEVLRRNSTLILSSKNKDKIKLCPSMNQSIQIKHYIGIPIIINLKTVGVFSIASYRNITVDKETITWAETIAHHLCAIFTREEVLRKLKINEHIASDMLEAISSPTVMCDPKGNIVHSNYSFDFILKQFFSHKYRINSKSNFLRMLKETGVDQLNGQQFSEMFSRIIDEQLTQTEFDVLLTKGSSRKWYLVHMSKVSNQDNVIIMFVDITKRKQVEEKLEHEILHDSSSGLANRMLFHDNLNLALSESVENNKPICVFSIDVGRFSFIVESLGHDAADEIMRHCARRIQSITSIDDLIARIGSSEFAILMHEINKPNEAKKFAKELISIFTTPFLYEHQEITLRPSIGITITTVDKYLDADTVLHDAHSAMTISRDTSTDQYAFASLKGSAFAIKKLNKERELSKAISKSQIFPYYQAEFDMNTNRVVGAEALARWQHPKHGILKPKHFIDIAEETNLIGPLFESMFTKVIADVVEIYDNGHNITIWTNISATQFQTHNISQIITELVNDLDAPIEMIGIEITETALMKDISQAAKEFSLLKNLGIKLALDDFGTGYSSLSHLSQLPVDMLKIDRSFVFNIINNESSLEIVSAVIGLSQGMKIKTLAEGIEGKDQLNLLRELGCDLGQGYYHHKPSDFNSFLNHVEKYQ